MTAFDEIIAKNGASNLPDYRKALISPLGSMISGKIPEFMDLTTRRVRQTLFDLDEAEEVDENTKPDQLGAIFIRKPNKLTRDYGFVFDKEGTEKILRELIAGNKIYLAKDFVGNFRFEDEMKAKLWQSAKDTTKRRLISKDLLQLKKKTDIEYRIHGSRLHYLTVGKVGAKIITNKGQETMSFPLFLFDCVETDHIKMTAEIDQFGFLNFPLDEKYFNSEIQKALGGLTIDADETLPTKLMTIKSKIEKLQLPNVEDINVDVSFSMISIVTGFEAEYLDKTWDKILA